MTYKPFYKVGDIVKILPFINSDMKDYACVRYVPGDIATIQEIIQEKEHDDYEFGLMGETCLYELKLHNPHDGEYDFGYAFESMIAPMDAIELPEISYVYDTTATKRDVFRPIGCYNNANLYCVKNGNKLETITGYTVDL